MVNHQTGCYRIVFGKEAVFTSNKKPYREFVMSSRKVIWYDFDDFRFDAEARRLFKNGVPVTLPPKTVQTLLVLLEHAGETVEKDEIYNRLWTDSFVEEGNLTQHIYLLRKNLGQGDTGQTYIETVARHGYRFTAEVKTVHAEIMVEVEAKAPDRIDAGDSALRITESAPEKKTETNGYLPKNEVQLNGNKEIVENERISETAAAPQNEKTSFRFVKFLPLAFVLLLAVGLGSYFYLAGSRTNPAIKSIAILPFKVIGEENPDEHLGLGMTDAIITRLSNLKQIPVRPTSAVFGFAGAGGAPEKIGRDLQVDAVLEGTIQQSKGWVRVSVRLIKVETGETLWADKFDGPAAHIFKVQDDISKKVVDSLALKLTPVQEQNIKKRATESTAAYDAYVLGIYFWNKRTKDALQKAEKYFLRAIELDPNYAQAYAGLADTYNMLAFNRFVPLTEVGEKAKNAALKAVQLDETVAEGHLALAQVQFAYEKNAEAGVESLERAIELAPFSATAHLRYGWRKIAEFRLDEAEREMRLAQEYDPLSPTHNLALCNILIFGRKYNEAAKFCEQALEIDRNAPGGRISLAEVYLFSGKTGRSLELAAEEVQKNPDDLYAQGFLAYVNARSGNLKEAVEIADRLKEKAENMPVIYIDLALTNYVCGRRAETFEILKKALEIKVVNRTNLVFDPKFDEIKKDAEFTDLMKQNDFPLSPPQL
jgi:TolB-like protein/DNA-binding winged helix-turn-helix (wHTH) protein